MTYRICLFLFITLAEMDFCSFWQKICKEKFSYDLLVDMKPDDQSWCVLYSSQKPVYTSFSQKKYYKSIIPNDVSHE